MSDGEGNLLLLAAAIINYEYYTHDISTQKLLLRTVAVTVEWNTVRTFVPSTPMRVMAHVAWTILSIPTIDCQSNESRLCRS